MWDVEMVVGTAEFVEGMRSCRFRDTADAARRFIFG
jgi:hypothetical protein